MFCNENEVQRKHFPSLCNQVWPDKILSLMLTLAPGSPSSPGNPMAPVSPCERNNPHAVSRQKKKATTDKGVQLHLFFDKDWRNVCLQILNRRMSLVMSYQKVKGIIPRLSVNITRKQANIDQSCVEAGKLNSAGAKISHVLIFSVRH